MSFIGSLAQSQPGTLRQAESCAFDRQAMLNLNYDAFDQDLRAGGGGWRKIANRPGCELTAADLIRDYRDENRVHEPLLYWHEGQLRALAGQTLQAVSLYERTKSEGRNDWNAYVDATVAFLEKDKAALVAARERLLAVEPPDGEVLVNGSIEIVDDAGVRHLFRWPLNIEVVDQLLECFGETYRNAQVAACREPTLRPHH